MISLLSAQRNELIPIVVVSGISSFGVILWHYRTPKNCPAPNQFNSVFCYKNIQNFIIAKLLLCISYHVSLFYKSFDYFIFISSMSFQVEYTSNCSQQTENSQRYKPSHWVSIDKVHTSRIFLILFQLIKFLPRMRMNTQWENYMM